MNSVQLIGRLTRDPELRYTPNGAAICSAGLAVNGRVKRGEEYVDQADFFDVKCFGKTAENLAQYQRKGAQIGVSGRLRQETWDDKTSGKRHSKIVVNAVTIDFLSSSNDERQSSANTQKTTRTAVATTPAAAPTEDDDVPF